MAVNRTVLPRKGIIQPKHGDNYEADLDANWQLIDDNMMGKADAIELGLAPSTPGNFTVAHGLDHEPFNVSIVMTSGGAIWFQTEGDGSLKKDASNLYLVASDGGITGRALIW